MIIPIALLAQLFADGQAVVLSGHHDVQDGNVKILALPFIDFQRFLPIGSLIWLVSGTFQINHNKFADGLFILCNQYFFHGSTPFPTELLNVRPTPIPHVNLAGTSLNNSHIFILFLTDQLKSIFDIIDCEGQRIIRRGDCCGKHQIVVVHKLVIPIRPLLAFPTVLCKDM